MLYATGLTDEDMHKAQVGISSVWYSGNPCNMHLLALNNIVKEGVEKAGQLQCYTSVVNWTLTAH
jgi:dihydroxy-acid dehydratase